MSNNLSYINAKTLTSNITNFFKKLKFLSLNLTISLTSLLPTLLPTTATAAPSTPPPSCFDFDSGTGNITDYYDYEANNNSNPACTREPIIPSTIGGNPVTTIGDSAFYNNQLTSVTIPNSVTSIGDHAFYRNQLTSVTIPNSVFTIENGAFSNSQLTSITIPNSVTSIGNEVFQHNQLTSVTIPNSVTSIGDHALSDNQLTSVTIEGNITTAGSNVFSGNPIQTFTYGLDTYTPSDPLTEDCFTFDGSNTLTGFNWADIATIRDHSNACLNPNVNIPSTIGGNSVTIIGTGAFENSQLTSLTIPNTVTSIGDEAFFNNRLMSVTIPITVTNMSEGSFMFNPLETVTYDGVTTTANTPLVEACFAFDSGTNTISGLKHVSLDVLQSDHNACIGTDLNIPSSIGGVDVNIIEDWAFSYMYGYFTHLTLPSTISLINENAFMANHLSEVTIPDSVTFIDSWVFEFQAKPGGVGYDDIATGRLVSNTENLQAWIDSVIYTNIYASPSQITALSLADSAMTEADMGEDLNADGDQTDIISGHLINPSRVTANYKDTNGNTIAPSTTATGTGLSSYLAVDNPTNNLSLYYRAGDSYTVPPAPTITGYTIQTTPSNIASLTAGNNSIDYIYTANSNNNNNEEGNNNSNIANLTTPTSLLSNFSLKPVNLTTPTGTTINSSSTVPESSLVAQDNNNQYPLGLVNFSFTTNQSSNQVVLNFITDLTPNQVTPRKYNSNTNSYNNLPTNANPTITETTIDNKHALTLTYTLIDNGELDLDNTLGIVKDPIGLAVSNQTYDQLANTGSNNQPIALIALVMITLAGGIGIASIKRKSYLYKC
jgi:LPXTG-motif cell wall-anchored protein